MRFAVCQGPELDLFSAQCSRTQDYDVHRRFGQIIVLAGLLALGGCESPRVRPPGTASPGLPAKGGYGLLFQLLGDEKDVSKLLIIKRERAELRELIRQIAQTSAEAHKKLEAFGRTAPELQLRETGLPAAEVETRESLAKAKAKTLLGQSGKDFELALLLSQQEATSYATHLAATLAKAERHPERAQFLKQLSSDFNQLHSRVVGVLTANYNLPAK